MLGAETIARMSDVAAWRAAEEGRSPLSVWGVSDLRHIPFLGEYCPAGWRPALWAGDQVPQPPRSVFAAHHQQAMVEVDASGWGSQHEPALTFDELDAYVKTVNRAVRNVGFGIREAGEFQIVVGVYVKDPGAVETGLPDEASVTCDECGTVHDPLEECDLYCNACGSDEHNDADCPEAEEDEEPVERIQPAPGQTALFA